MTTDQDDSSSTWQNPGDGDDDENDRNGITGYGSAPPAQNMQAQFVNTRANQVDSADSDDAVDEDEDQDDGNASFFTLESLRNFGRLFSPILVPLPFALFVFIITYVVIYKSPHPNLQPLPLAILLLALAILQGTMLYYVGSNDDLWLLCLALGYTLFLLVGTFAIFGLRGAIILLIIILVIVLFYARRGVRIVAAGSVEIVHSFGKYSRTLDSGPAFLWPWEKVVQRVSIKEKVWTTPLQVVKISRDQDVRLIATISFQVVPEDAYLTLSVENWEESLHKLFIGTLQALVSQLSPADFTAWPQAQGQPLRSSHSPAPLDPIQDTRWDRINHALASRTQDRVAGWGVQVNWVRIQDITLIPHLMPVTTAPPGMQAQTKRPVPAASHAPDPADQPAQQPTRTGTPVAPGPSAGDDDATVVMVSNAVQQREVPPQPASTSDAPTDLSSRPISMDSLKELYEAVRQSRITDPNTIRGIARQFEVVSHDPQLSQNADFDAARAARTLYQRAKSIEDNAQARVGSNTKR
ncbi:MAG TPA: SPFH domain-containing protein [Ktedonobacteraceae bacterium]|nr:SPFH domain-containing protein [Ktedonobacteraceae bacterium]